MFILYILFFFHRGVIESFASSNEENTLVEKFYIARARGRVVLFVPLLFLLVFLEKLALWLTFSPSVRKEISSRGWDEQVEEARKDFPFQMEILPQVLLGAPFITVPFLAALWGYYAILFIKWDVKLAIMRLQNEGLFSIKKGLEAKYGKLPDSPLLRGEETPFFSPLELSFEGIKRKGGELLRSAFKAGCAGAGFGGVYTAGNTYAKIRLEEIALAKQKEEIKAELAKRQLIFLSERAREFHQQQLARLSRWFPQKSESNLLFDKVEVVLPNPLSAEMEAEKKSLQGAYDILVRNDKIEFRKRKGEVEREEVEVLKEKVNLWADLFERVVKATRKTLFGEE